jgi:hypothetical protein
MNTLFLDFTAAMLCSYPQIQYKTSTQRSGQRICYFGFKEQIAVSQHRG